MEFNPNNPVVKLCVEGIRLEEKGQPEEAGKIFIEAWNESANEFEKFIAAYYVARHQKTIPDKLKWLEASLQAALKTDSEGVKGALPSLYANIAKCNEDLHDFDNAKKNAALATAFTGKPTDKGPFYHGTKADLKVGDLLTAGNRSNYQEEVIMNHVYFTAIVNGAGLAAELAKGDTRARVYIVEPTGDFENDPNVTDKKFPGNLTRSYRTGAALKIVGEVTDWVRLTPDQLRNWREKLAGSKGEIIN
ncbi:MAG: NAD(+)--rifampin ADP-ribosyltransferase [Bacteroidota bacterium]